MFFYNLNLHYVTQFYYAFDNPKLWFMSFMITHFYLFS